MTETGILDAATALDVATEEGRLVEDVDCRHCGYNLRGLAADGRCPECTTAIARSVMGDLLRYCEPDWVERLAAGMKLYVVAILAAVAVTVLFSVGLVVVMTSAPAASTPLIIVMITVLAGVTGLQLLAYWKITTPDPGHDESARPVTPRAVARYGLITGAVVGIVAKVGGYVLNPPVPLGVRTAVWFVAAFAAVVGLVGMAALFVYAISLARRLPDDPLARSTRIVMWGYLITTSAMQAAGLVHEAIAPNIAALQTPQIVFGIVMVAVMVPGLVFLIWGIVLLWRYRDRLARAAAQARETWARPVGGVTHAA